MNAHLPRLSLLRVLGRRRSSDPNHYTESDLVNKVRQVVDQVEASSATLTGSKDVADWIDCPANGHDQA